MKTRYNSKERKADHMKKQSKSVQHLFGVAFTVLFVLTGFISGSSGNGSLVNAQESGGDGAATPSTIAFPVALAIDSSNAATLYTGTTNGVFKSTDSGANWRQVGLRDFFILYQFEKEIVH